uniref:Uncharacterized protein n=1 Tax=Manihot esculenta TaxID=3983 RepID=A0A2C9VZ84_MANES
MSVKYALGDLITFVSRTKLCLVYIWDKSVLNLLEITDQIEALPFSLLIQTQTHTSPKKTIARTCYAIRTKEFI